VGKRKHADATAWRFALDVDDRIRLKHAHE
jgi:hypothetical protein